MRNHRILHIIAIFLAVSAIASGVHSLLFAQGDAGSLHSLNESGVDDSTEREILSLLLELKSIDLDARLFESNAFKSLQDFGVTLEPEPISRPNPFAPIGQDVELPESGSGEADSNDN